jgi:hypothetical protein
VTNRQFDGFTHWGPRSDFIAGFKEGWRAPGHGENISVDDPYWGSVLAQAQKDYGDPNITFNTGDPGQERYLVFGDGTRLPQDGTIDYHDAATKQNWVQHDDGSAALLDPNGHEGPSVQPVAIRKVGDHYAPVDEHGTQIGRLEEQPRPNDGGYHTDPKTGLLTPADKDGNYFEIDPATGKKSYFNKDGKPIAGPGQPPPDTKAPGKHTPPDDHATFVALGAGMHLPKYPDWAIQDNPSVETEMDEALARLYNMLGKGDPATPTTPEFPFNTDTGQDSNIDNYDKLRAKFKALETEFNSSRTAFGDAVKNSKFKVETGRDAINKAIDDFGDKVHNLPTDQYEPLIQAETDMLSSVRSTIADAAAHAPDVPDPAPAPGPADPAAPTAPLPAPAPGTDPGDSTMDDLVNRLGGGMPGLGGMPGMGGMNPLGGMNPFGGGGQGISPTGGGAPAQAASRLPDPGNDPTKPAVTPLNPVASAGVPTPTPVGGPTGDSSGNGATGAPVVVPAGNPSGPGTTVSLPDGKTVSAPNTQAAKAATNALNSASPGGDPAQKAYSGVMDLPGDGKNPGAKVDPGDMQAGDVLKWQDKTMVAAGPGLVADPTHPGTVHQLQDVLKDGKGFQGIFRPTAVDPTLTAHSAPPPVVDVGDQHPVPPASPPSAAGAPDHPAPPAAPAPADPAPSTVQLAAPEPPPPAAPAAEHTGPQPQPAPPSPFGPHATPPATRSTKAERTTAGTE